jgi:integrase/recombinase XerD
MSKVVRKRKPVPPPSTPLAALMEKHLEDLLLKNYSEYTIKRRRVHIGFFLDWATERGIGDPVEVTRTVLEAYQRHVFNYRKKNGEPLGFNGQHDRIVPLRMWFKWMARQHHILHNPASELELPRVGMRLPKAVLTASEAERILQGTKYPRCAGAARSGHHGDAVHDRDAPAGAGESEAVGSRYRARHGGDQAG